ncbi:SLAP domain-containing protein [Alkalibacillus salilacus]|uniref:SLAP domain-containing protein n=1 Tax=Alkalibacillus salilacus TaxID=284582 RepID=A0ABT9VFK9_9BACI|nr:SLAP domain-containing protein [Alkalibacillus salilacus]MDQ0159723.1 SLAP domain-containing protein [Alkalibacillus salilacus]
MQQLIFEEKWDKTIAEEDRTWIESQFENISFDDHSGISFTVLNHAFNHRNHLLVTALVHNCTDQPVTIKDQSMTWGTQATGTFTLPVAIDANYSMPWTFIFTDYSNEIDQDAELNMISTN